MSLLRKPNPGAYTKVMTRQLNSTATDTCRTRVAALTTVELDAVIKGTLRLGVDRDEDLLIWNLAIDRANGYDD